MAEPLVIMGVLALSPAIPMPAPMPRDMDVPMVPVLMPPMLSPGGEKSDWS